MAFVSTLGSETANSLISVARAETILGDLPQTDGVIEWLALVAADQERTLVAASMTLQGLKWKGKQCSETQALAWPRLIDSSGVYAVCEKLPYEIEMATAYLAAFLGLSGGYVAIGEEGGPVKTEGTNPFPGLSPEDLAGYENVELGNGAIKLKLAAPAQMQPIEYIPPFSMQLINRFAIMPSGIHHSNFSRRGAATIYPPYVSSVRNVGMVEIDGKLWPKTGGWASNPL